MIKKIVASTVVVLLTLLVGCDNRQTSISVFNNTSLSFGITRDVIREVGHFGFMNLSDVLKSHFAHSDNQSEVEPEKVIRISDYDDLIKEISAEQGHDWRFISAIAYNESRFNPKAVSHMGARGLMQIMPIVAREFKVEQHRVFEPEVNVWLAAKLLSDIERRLRLPNTVSEKDKKSLILACYNGGIGHVSDARRLARKHGANPNKWEDVSHYLKMKSLPEYHTDEVVYYGRFIGSGETLGFVDKVLNKYATYCSL